MEKMLDRIKIIPKIKEVKISDYGIIKKADIRFKDGLNILVGGNRTGKTNVIDYIQKHDAKSILDLSKGEQVCLLFEGLTISNKCLLIDGVFPLDLKKDEILASLSRSKCQSIITMLEIPEIKADIIETKEFTLRSDGLDQG